MNIKYSVHKHCVSLIEKQIKTLQLELESARNAANDDTKSTAGDKHETGRAMMHLEQEKISKQLSDALKMKQLLAKINPVEQYKTVQFGSLIKTSSTIFYIAIPLGKITIENNEYFAISAQSPIGKQLIGKKQNDIIVFNGKEYAIKEVL